jgi:transcriptional regulator
LMTAYPFGTLVTHGGNGLDAICIPFHLDPSQGPNGMLKAHDLPAPTRSGRTWRKR